MAFRPAIFYRYVPPLDIAGLTQTLVKRLHTIRPAFRRCAAEKPNHRPDRLLCMGGEDRPSDGHTRSKLDQVASLHRRPLNLTVVERGTRHNRAFLIHLTRAFA